jgi:hypothetical protein
VEARSGIVIGVQRSGGRRGGRRLAFCIYGFRGKVGCRTRLRGSGRG